MSFSCTFFFCSCSFLFFSLFFLILLNFSPQFCLCLSCSFILAFFFFLFFIVIFVVSIILFYSFMLLVLIVLLRLLLLLLLLVIRPFPFLIRHYLLLFLLRLCCYHMIPSIGQHPGSVALADRRQKTITIVTKSEQSRPKHFDQ